MTNKEAIEVLEQMKAQIANDNKWLALHRAIKALEERPHGKWIYHRAQGEFLPYMECDNCHEEFLLNMLRPAEFRKVNRFCSNCGADMRGKK